MLFQMFNFPLVFSACVHQLLSLLASVDKHEQARWPERRSCELASEQC